MSRFASYGPRDETPLRDGDLGFVGVDQWRPATQLAPNWVADARNARFREGQAQSRPGVAKLTWTNNLAVGSGTPQPLATIWGACEFRDPNGAEWAIIAAGGRVYRTREGNALAEITIPAGETVNYDVSFSQTFNGLVMFRGADRDEWYLTDLDEGFGTIAEEDNEISGENTENPEDGANPIPPASNGEWIGNRLFIPYQTETEKDLLAISDYLNATRYADVRSQARINQGSSDSLVRVAKFNEFCAVCFKSASIYALYNIKADLTEMYLDEVTRECGLIAPYSVVAVGRNADQEASQLWFLSSRHGIMSLMFGEYGRLQMLSVPVSRPIQKVIDRIDWRYADRARAAYWENKVYFAVPLDSSRVYSAVTLPAAVYGGGATLTVYVVPGQTYRWAPGSSTDTSCTNGGTTYTDAIEFTAAQNTITLTGAGAGAAVGCTLERVFTETNNAVLVYDFVMGAWAGYDDGPAYCVKEFLKLTYNNEVRLFFVAADGSINVMESLACDQVLRENGSSWLALNLGAASYDGDGRNIQSVSPEALYVYALGAYDTGIINGSQTLTDTYGSFVAAADEITLTGTASHALSATVHKVVYDLESDWVDFSVLSRAYSCQDLTWKEFQWGNARLATWYPTYTVAVVLDGAGEEYTIVEDVTRDPTNYYKPFTQADWDRTNVNDDHATPYREDYSVILDEAAVTSGLAAGVSYYVENLAGSAGIVYNSVYRTARSTFVGVAGETTFTTPETSLVAQWKFEESTGDRVDSKNAHNFTPVNTPGRTTGKSGYALSITGATQFLNQASHADLVMGDIDFTICGWWKFTTLAGAARLMIGKGYAGDAALEYCLAADSSPQTIKFYVHHGASLGTVNSGVVPVEGTWYWVCAWHDATANKIWIQVNNGTPVSANHTAGTSSGTRPLRVGDPDYAQPFLGAVDAVHIWKRVLTTGERAALYASGAGLEIGLSGAVNVYPPGGYVFLGESGIDFDLEQDCVVPLELDGRMRGRHLQVRVSNDQGRCALVDFEVEAMRAARRLATKV